MGRFCPSDRSAGVPVRQFRYRRAAGYDSVRGLAAQPVNRPSTDTALETLAERFTYTRNNLRTRRVVVRAPSASVCRSILLSPRMYKQNIRPISVDRGSIRLNNSGMGTVKGEENPQSGRNYSIKCSGRTDGFFVNAARRNLVDYGIRR